MVMNLERERLPLTQLQLYDFAPAGLALQQEVLTGLRQTPKQLYAKFNYDEAGAKLYEQLCETPDYYVARTELAIMQHSIGAIAACLRDDILLIEYGSGNSQKTRLLFDHLPRLVAYIPIDIAKQQLLETSAAVARAYPTLEVLPVYADYEQEFVLPTPTRPVARRLIYYPGSTIGNTSPAEAIRLLQRFRCHCQPGDALLIGVDLQKDPAILMLAYNDRAGISKQFNISNVVKRFNRELGADFVISQFQHYVRYNESAARVEIYWQSLCDQTVRINGEAIHFTANELIESGVAYKYSLPAFQELAAAAGWRQEQVWTDEQQWFSVQYLVATE